MPDNRTIRTIASIAGLPAQGEILAAVHAGRIAAASTPLSGPLALEGTSPQTVEVDGERYRAVGGAVAPGTRLAVLARTRRVDAAADSIRTRILLIGLLVLGVVMLMAYVLAPAIGRARVARNQRVVAERVLAHVADGVMLLDPAGIVRFWNRAAETMTGLAAERVLDANADDAIPGWRDARQRIQVGDTRDLESGWSSTMVPMDIEGRELWLAVSGVRFDEGTVYSFRDITERERLDQAKTDFVATVSHELRTPLASVYGAALTLQHQFARVQKAQRDRLLELIAQEAQRLSSIIDDILLANRLDTGPLELARERFDAEHVARSVVTAAQHRAPEAISIELTTPPFLPDATGDGEKVGQVLGNLVDNAVKYSPGGGRVDVVLETVGDRIRFTVRDSGLGIPLDEQERIFLKFYRLDPNLTRGIGGTGLGLYIARALVRRMGGDISVDSAPGRGSAFSFELPVARVTTHLAEPIGSA
jgi:PAS domain S-box-containing protein